MVNLGTDMRQRTELLSVKETVGWLKISPATLFRLVRAGKLAPVKLGRRTLFAANEIEDLIQRPLSHRRVIPAVTVERPAIVPPVAVEEWTPAKRESLLSSLRERGVIWTPSEGEKARAAEYDRQHPPEEQERILAELRQLDINPPLSQVITNARQQRPGTDWVVLS